MKPKFAALGLPGEFVLRRNLKGPREKRESQ